jgi:biotin carboxylase
VTPTAPTLLCVASHLKGQHLLREARRLGCRVYLLTHSALLDSPWPREAIEDVFALPDFSDMHAVRHAVGYLARGIKFDRFVPLGDYDVEVTADLREHLRVPGMGVTVSRNFRDKLTMRERAAEFGLDVPAFTGLIHDADVDAFLGTVPGPWVLKPRMEAGSKGITVIHTPSELWAQLETLGDARGHYLLERFVPGDVYHVDAIVYRGQVVFSSAQRYGKPILHLKQQGGVYSTRTIARDTPLERGLQSLNRQVIAALGMTQGVTHIEYIQSRDDGQFYFLEAAARVGAAKISDVIHAATGVCLWHEWARLEAASVRSPYVIPVAKRDHAGVVITVAGQEKPDYRGYDDPEIIWRQTTRPYHAGLMVKSPDAERVEQLVSELEQRMAREFAPQPVGV